MKESVTQLDGAYRITDSHVSLDSIVYAWRDGLSPESIRENFPVLTLEEVYGAITFYLANQTAIDPYLSLSESQVCGSPAAERRELHGWHCQLQSQCLLLLSAVSSLPS
jgi:uncharacterized protein (DUF433 family)